MTENQKKVLESIRNGEDLNKLNVNLSTPIKVKYLASWIERVKEFQSLPQSEQSSFCSYCQCEGGCNLCKNINDIDESQIINDLVNYENSKK